MIARSGCRNASRDTICTQCEHPLVFGVSKVSHGAVKLWISGLLAGAAGAMLAVTALPVSGQAPRAAIPRTVAGKPDLNGIWQALNSANWDIEAHTARPALAMRPGPVVPVPAKEVLAFGAVGSVPSGIGVVVGGEIPYLLAAKAQKDQNQAQWLSRGPERR